MKIIEITVRPINNTISPEKKEINSKKRENAIKAFNQGRAHYPDITKALNYQAIKPTKSKSTKSKRK
jgi:hypothetical protein